MTTLPTVDMAMASREELVAGIRQQPQVIAPQPQVIGALQERVARLEQRRGSSGGTGMPGRKPTTDQRSKATGARMWRTPAAAATCTRGSPRAVARST